MPSKIEWTEETWNPVVGCTKVSRGCKNCYAEQVARRFMGIANFSAGDKSIQHVFLMPERLGQPLRWKRPRRIFVNSMSDLFHEDVPDEFIDEVFACMALAKQHTYQVLTKRPDRMREWFTSTASGAQREFIIYEGARYASRHFTNIPLSWPGWPLPNVWLGVSVEDQKTADERIPLLLQTPATVRWVSYEPALGPVDFYPWIPWNEFDGTTHVDATGVERFDLGGAAVNPLDWIVVGGESGPKARPFDLAWARSTIAQCRAAGIPCFVKQLGARPSIDHDSDRPLTAMQKQWSINLKDRKGGEPDEWPADLRVREYPS